MKKVFFLYCISLLCIYGCNDDSDKYSSNFLKSREVTLNYGIYNRLLINILQTTSQKYGCGP